MLRFLPKSYLLPPETQVQENPRRCRAEPCAEHSAQAIWAPGGPGCILHCFLPRLKQYRHNQWDSPRSSSEELFNCKYNSTHIILSVLLGRRKSQYAQFVGVISIVINPLFIATKVHWQCPPQSSQVADRHTKRFCFHWWFLSGCWVHKKNWTGGLSSLSSMVTFPPWPSLQVLHFAKKTQRSLGPGAEISSSEWRSFAGKWKIQI